MNLQGVKIQGLSSLISYFDFKEIYEFLKSDDGYTFYDFGENNLSSNTSMAKVYLFGTQRKGEKSRNNGGALRLINNPELCLEEEFDCGNSNFKSMFVPCDTENESEVKNVRVNDIVFFAHNMWMIFQSSYAKIHPELGEINQADNQEWKRLKKSVYSAVEKTTEKGHRLFTPEAAVEMYIYFLLHALVGILPDNPKSMKYLENDLMDMCPVSDVAKHQKSFFTLSCNDVPLDYYEGKENSDSLINIIELKNNREIKLRVTIKNTVISRTVFPGASVFALRKGNQIVSFLPRFSLDNEGIRSLDKGKLMTCYEGGEKEYEETELEEPVTWVSTVCNGCLVINKDGVLDEADAWDIGEIEKPVVMVDAYALDYSLLFSDGTTKNRLLKENWKNLISVNIGLNSGIAINTGREPVLHNGKIIRSIKASEAKAYENHYICMDKKGSIVTDSGLHMSETVYAISVCEKGYVLALEDKVCMYDFSNNCIAQWNVCGVTEIDSNERCIGYYDGNADEVKTIKLNK